jgi:flagellar L-ring protein precursor FlgH
MDNIVKRFRIYLLQAFIPIILILATSFLSVNAQFIQNSSRSLFSDVKAFKTGDAIMVFIMEDTQAGNNAATASNRSTALNANVGLNTTTKNNTVQGNLGTGNTFDSKGATTRNETIRSRLSVRVTEIDGNGNLKIEGTRTTKVNGETQKIIIRGSVRPVDVMADNSVYSYNILDLTLFIEGDGSVSEVQEPGLITKFLRMLF